MKDKNIIDGDLETWLTYLYTLQLKIARLIIALEYKQQLHGYSQKPDYQQSKWSAQ